MKGSAALPEAVHGCPTATSISCSLFCWFLVLFFFFSFPCQIFVSLPVNTEPVTYTGAESSLAPVSLCGAGGDGAGCLTSTPGRLGAAACTGSPGCWWLSLSPPARLGCRATAGLAAAPAAFGAARPCSGLLQRCLRRAGELPPASHTSHSCVAALHLQAPPRLGEGVPLPGNARVVPSARCQPGSSSRHPAQGSRTPPASVWGERSPWFLRPVFCRARGEAEALLMPAMGAWVRALPLRPPWAWVALAACPAPGRCPPAHPASPPCCLSSVTGDRSTVTTSSESHSRLQD